MSRLFFIFPSKKFKNQTPLPKTQNQLKLGSWLSRDRFHTNVFKISLSIFLNTLLFFSLFLKTSHLKIQNSCSTKKMVHPEKSVARNPQKTSHILKANKNHTKSYWGNINLLILAIPRKSTDYDIMGV